MMVLENIEELVYDLDDYYLRIRIDVDEET